MPSGGRRHVAAGGEWPTSKFAAKKLSPDAWGRTGKKRREGGHVSGEREENETTEGREAKQNESERREERQGKRKEKRREEERREQ